MFRYPLCVTAWCHADHMTFSHSVKKAHTDFKMQQGYHRGVKKVRTAIVIAQSLALFQKSCQVAYQQTWKKETHMKTSTILTLLPVSPCRWPWSTNDMEWKVWPKKKFSHLLNLFSAGPWDALYLHLKVKRYKWIFSTNNLKGKSINFWIISDILKDSLPFHHKGHASIFKAFRISTVISEFVPMYHEIY